MTHPTERELLPCPFCGQAPVFNKGDLCASVECSACDYSLDYILIGKPAPTLDDNIAAVFKAWNTRATPQLAAPMPDAVGAEALEVARLIKNNPDMTVHLIARHIQQFATQPAADSHARVERRENKPGKSGPEYVRMIREYRAKHDCDLLTAKLACERRGKKPVSDSHADIDAVRFAVKCFADWLPEHSTDTKANSYCVGEAKKAAFERIVAGLSSHAGGEMRSAGQAAYEKHIGFVSFANPRLGQRTATWDELTPEWQNQWQQVAQAATASAQPANAQSPAAIRGQNG